MIDSDQPGPVNIKDLPLRVEKDLIIPRIQMFIGFSVLILLFLIVVLFVIAGILDNPLLILVGIIYLIVIVWLVLDPDYLGLTYRHPGFALVYPDKVLCFEQDRMVKEIHLDPSVEVNLVLHHSNMDDTWVDGYRFEKGTDSIIISTSAGYRRVDIERMWDLFTILIRKHHMKGNQDTAIYLKKWIRSREQDQVKDLRGRHHRSVKDLENHKVRGDQVQVEDSVGQVVRIDKTGKGPHSLFAISAFIMIGSLVIIISTIYIYHVEGGVLAGYLLIWVLMIGLIYGGSNLFGIADISQGYVIISSRRIIRYRDDKPFEQILFDASVKADVHYNSIWTTDEHGPLYGFSFQQGSTYIEFSGQNGYSVEEIRQIKPFIHSVVQLNNMQMSDMMNEYWMKHPINN